MTLVTELLGFYREDGISFIYNSLRDNLNSFSVGILPMELKDSIVAADMTQDQLNIQKFVKHVMDTMVISNSMQPIELIFSVVNSKKRFRLDL